MPPQTQRNPTRLFFFFTKQSSTIIAASPRMMQIRLMYYAYACAVKRKQNKIIADPQEYNQITYISTAVRYLGALKG
jgi:hypothetical protein